MRTLLAVAAVLGGVVVAATVVAVAGGWRPGGRSRPTAGLVREQARRDLDLPDADWRAVCRAVDRGRPVPDRLRPAAYELARRTLAQQEGTAVARRPRVAAGVAVAYGLAVGAVYWVTDEDDPLWLDVLRPLPPAGLALGLLWALRRERRRLRAAVEANRPAG